MPIAIHRRFRRWLDGGRNAEAPRDLSEAFANMFYQTPGLTGFLSGDGRKRRPPVFPSAGVRICSFARQLPKRRSRRPRADWSTCLPWYPGPQFYKWNNRCDRTARSAQLIDSHLVSLDVDMGS